MSAVACKHLRPRRFAPLGSAETSTAPLLKGIVFDVDGTLWRVTFPLRDALYELCDVVLFPVGYSLCCMHLGELIYTSWCYCWKWTGNEY